MEDITAVKEELAEKQQALEALQRNFDDFQESSRELEEELEAELGRVSVGTFACFFAEEQRSRTTTDWSAKYMSWCVLRGQTARAAYPRRCYGRPKGSQLGPKQAVFLSPPARNKEPTCPPRTPRFCPVMMYRPKNKCRS